MRSLLLPLFFLLAPLAPAAPFRTALEDFLANHCYDCHADGTKKGGLDFDSLGSELSDPATFANWEHIFDRVAAGEMPPKKKERPGAKDLASFREHLTPALAAAHAASTNPRAGILVGVAPSGVPVGVD